MSANKENIAYIPPPVPQARLEGANAAMLVLTSVVFLTRVVIRISQRKPYELHDLFCHLAFVSYVVMWILYFLENDPYYRMERVQRGVIPPYPGIRKCCCPARGNDCLGWLTPSTWRGHALAMGDSPSDMFLCLTHTCKNLNLVSVPQVVGSNAEKVYCDLVVYTNVLSAGMPSARLEPGGLCWCLAVLRG